MVKICHSFVLFSAAAAIDDAEAMMQLVQLGTDQARSTESTVRVRRQQQALEMESNFEKLAAEAVRSGETPSLGVEARTAVNSALTTLETELSNEHLANEDTIVQANLACAQCNSDMGEAFTKRGGVNGFKEMVSEARTKHVTCRASEDSNSGDEKQKCDSQDDYAKTAAGAAPHCPCETYTTADSMKVCLQKAGDWGLQYNAELGKKIAKCGTATETAGLTESQCDKDQTSFESGFCQYEVSLTSACQSHNDCYNHAKSNRVDAKASTMAKEKSEKVMWKSVKKVRCYLDMLDATKVTQDKYNDCKKLQIDTAHLSVEYPEPVDEAECDKTSVNTLPGDPEWKLAEYHGLTPKNVWLDGRNGIKQVTPCVSVPPAGGPKCTLSPTWNAGSEGEANARRYANCLLKENEDGLQFVLSTSAEGDAEMTCSKLGESDSCSGTTPLNDWGMTFKDFCPKHCAGVVHVR